MDMDIESTIGVNLRVTAHSNQGGRKYMEDMLSVAYQPTGDEKDLLYAYFGIFDGHGGREAAAYTKDHLMHNIVCQKNFWSTDDESVLKAIRDGFVNTHYAMRKELDRWPKTIYGLPSTSGTTASIAFVRRNKLYIGHVGDSAIVLGYQDSQSGHWRAKPLTVEHKPESVDENARITQCGGKVVKKSGVPRVVWNRPRIGHKGPVRRSTQIDEIPFLAVARSLGDFWSYNSDHNEFVVSPDPDVLVVDIDIENFRCLIFASDGLWNMLNAQEAVNSVFYSEKNNERLLLASPPDTPRSQMKNWINPARRLVERALDCWYRHSLRADNTSVVTVVIDPPGPQKSQVIRGRDKCLNHILRNSPETCQETKEEQKAVKEGKTHARITLTPTPTGTSPTVFRTPKHTLTSPQKSVNQPPVTVSSKRSAVGTAQRKSVVDSGSCVIPKLSTSSPILASVMPKITGSLTRRNLSVPANFPLKPAVVISGVKPNTSERKPPVFTERRRDRLAQAMAASQQAVTVVKTEEGAAESAKKLIQNVLPALGTTTIVTSTSTNSNSQSTEEEVFQKRSNKRKLKSTHSSKSSSDEVDTKKVALSTEGTLEGTANTTTQAVQIHEVSSSNEFGVASVPENTDIKPKLPISKKSRQRKKKANVKKARVKKSKRATKLKRTSISSLSVPPPPDVASSPCRTRRQSVPPSLRKAERTLRSDTAAASAKNKKAKVKKTIVKTRVPPSKKTHVLTRRVITRSKSKQ